MCSLPPSCTSRQTPTSELRYLVMFQMNGRKGLKWLQLCFKWSHSCGQRQEDVLFISWLHFSGVKVSQLCSRNVAGALLRLFRFRLWMTETNQTETQVLKQTNISLMRKNLGYLSKEGGEIEELKEQRPWSETSYRTNTMRQYNLCHVISVGCYSHTEWVQEKRRWGRQQVDSTDRKALWWHSPLHQVKEGGQTHQPLIIHLSRSIIKVLYLSSTYAFPLKTIFTTTTLLFAASSSWKQFAQSLQSWGQLKDPILQILQILKNVIQILRCIVELMD